MLFGSNLFSRSTKGQDVPEIEEQDDEETEDKKEVSNDLFFIEETLLKLELINVSHGKIEYLTRKITDYQNQLEKIKEDYEKGVALDFVTLSYNRKTSDYDNKISYLVRLSTLADEVSTFSKVYFYLESLDVFFHQEITEFNVEEKGNELLELEKSIRSISSIDEESSKMLHQTLMDTIEFFLEKEISFPNDHKFYMRLSRSSQKEIDIKYLKKLSERVENDSYIQKYLKENNIGTLEFDYEMFSYMALGKVTEKKLEVEDKEQVYLNGDLTITIPSMDQIFWSDQLAIFQKRGAKAAMCDYAIISGGQISKDFYVGDSSKTLADRTGDYWTSSDDQDNDAYSIYYGGVISRGYVASRNIGVRPILPFSSISNICQNKKEIDDDILEVEFGEYPQQAASKNLQEVLEKLYQKGKLVKTSKIYTRDKTGFDQDNKNFEKEPQEEYWYKGKRYVRVRVNSCYEEFMLSNGEQYKDGDYVWTEVQPIKWLVDIEKNTAIAEKILFAGVQFNNQSGYEGDFESTNLYWYLNTYFVKEMMPSKDNIFSKAQEIRVRVKQEKIKSLSHN